MLSPQQQQQVYNWFVPIAFGLVFWLCLFVFMYLKFHVHTYHFSGNRWSSHDAAAVSPTAKRGTRRRLPALGTKTPVSLSPRHPSLSFSLCSELQLPVGHLSVLMFVSVLDLLSFIQWGFCSVPPHFWPLKHRFFAGNGWNSLSRWLVLNTLWFSHWWQKQRETLRLSV